MTVPDIAFSLVDVFTRERFLGNQLAVIHDARALDGVQMQKIAREFGFSETAFVLPPRDAAHHAHVRIFTPLAEVPFAGHPTIGTAFVIGTQATAARAPLPQRAIFEARAGRVQVRPIREEGRVVGAEIAAPQPLRIVGRVAPEILAACLGLAERDLVLRRLTPCVASVGLPFAFVELRDLDALAAVAPDAPRFRAAAARGPRTVDGFAVCAFAVLSETQECTKIRSRVLSPLGHPAEDPATGSASGALAGLLADASGRGKGRFEIAQGVEMGRRSEIEVTVAEDPKAVLIRGRCVEVATGAMKL